MQRLSLISCLIAVALLTWSARVPAAAEGYAIDPTKSEVTIQVGKAGLLSFAAGHTHEVVGPIEGGAVDLDREDVSRSHVRIVIGTSTLKVTGKGESREDVPKVQQNMESDKVLDVAHFPQLTFDSTSVTQKNHDPSAFDLAITGQLTIRDVTRTVTVPVRVDLTGETLTAAGRFSVKQTTFGIKPITVAGVVSVKDALDISFSIVARRP